MSTNNPRYGSQPGAQGPEGTQWSQPTPPEQPMQPPTGQPSSQPTVPTNPYAVPQPGSAHSPYASPQSTPPAPSAPGAQPEWAQPSQVPPAQQVPPQPVPAPGSAQQVPPPGQQPFMQDQQPYAQGQRPYAQGPMGTVPPVGPAPAKKSKTGLVVGILVAVAVLFIGALVALGLIVNSIMKEVETTTEPFTSNPSTSAPSTASPSTTDPSTTDPSPSSSEAIPVRQTANVGDWEVNVDSYTPDATADVAAAYIWNEPAGTGNVYKMVHLIVTYRGSDGTEGDYLYMDFDLVTESGTTIGWYEGSAAAMAADDLFARETAMSPGQSVTGNILFEVPRDETFTAFRVSDEMGQFIDVPLP